jgi:hypothetical protein
LTREEIRSVYKQPEAVSARLAGLGRQLPELTAGGKELEARLTLNRHTSSTPPSRDRRMIKGQQQVSGCFRPPAGAKVFWRMRGSLSTMKKQGQQVLTARKSVFTGQPVMPALPG